MTYPQQQKYVLLGKETTWGTAVSATKDVGVLIEDASNGFDREVKESMTLSAIDVQKITSGVFTPKCTIGGEFQHGRMLEYIFGAVAHLETTGDWVHTFTIDDNPPSATIEMGNDSTVDTVWDGEGMLVESAEISISLNETLKLITEWKGEDVNDTASAGTPIVSSLQVFPHALVVVKLNGSQADEVQDASIKITRTNAFSAGAGHNLAQQGHAVEIKFEYSAKLGFQDKTFHDLALGGTTAPDTSDPTAYNFEITADNGTALGSGQRKMTLVLTGGITKTFNEVSTIGSLTFIDITGSATLSSCTSTDNISSATW